MQALLALPAEPAAAGASSPQDLLSTALSVAGPATAAILADGILRLYELQLSSRAPPSQRPQPAASCRAHPLSRALLSNAAAAQSLVLAAARLLARVADGAGGHQLAATLAAPAPLPLTLAAGPAAGGGTAATAGRHAFSPCARGMLRS